MAKQLGYGRMAIGAVMLAAPKLVAVPWTGDASETTALVTRLLGAREVLLGFLAAHTAERPGVGSRTVQSVAALDAVDAVATFAARSSLPKTGVALTVGMAGGSAAAGTWIARQLPS